MSFQIDWIESRFLNQGKIANEMIIIHHTGSKNGQINSFQGTIDWFKPGVWRNNYQVSAQYIIARVDRPIVQMVPDNDTAWHAGRSKWIINGTLREKLNVRSIGIELQGDGNLAPYTNFQYEALIWLVKQKIIQFNIPVELVRGHQEVSSHKVDPGEMFDWSRLRSGLTSTTVGGSDIPHNDLSDTDGDGVIYIDETDDVSISDGKDRTIVERIFNAILSLFK